MRKNVINNTPGTEPQDPECQQNIIDLWFTCPAKIGLVDHKRDGIGVV